MFFLKNVIVTNILNKVLDKLANNHPHHTNCEAYVQNDNYKLSYLDNILYTKHMSDSVVVNQIIFCSFWIGRHEHLKIFFLFFLNDCNYFLHVEKSEAMENSDVLGDIEKI